MGDGHGGNVVEPPQNLIGVEFDEERAELVFFDDLVEIVAVVVHDDIEIL